MNDTEGLSTKFIEEMEAEARKDRMWQMQMLDNLSWKSYSNLDEHWHNYLLIQMI